MPEQHGSLYRGEDLSVSGGSPHGSRFEIYVSNYSTQKWYISIISTQARYVANYSDQAVYASTMFNRGRIFRSSYTDEKHFDQIRQLKKFSTKFFRGLCYANYPTNFGCFMQITQLPKHLHYSISTDIFQSILSVLIQRACFFFTLPILHLLNEQLQTKKPTKLSKNCTFWIKNK